MKTADRTSENTKERLARLRATKEARESLKADVAEMREVELLELEERLETELGPRGSYFELVDTVEGPIALKLGEAILHTRFSESKVTSADVHDYVFPCVVHPSKEKYLELVGRRPAIAVRCASALASLFGAKAGADASKY